MNVNGAGDNRGWNFNNKISSPDATVYFPASGYRSGGGGELASVGNGGYYWSAVPYDEEYDCTLYFFSQGYVHPHSYARRAYGYSVRPVAEPKTRVTPKTPGSSVEAWQEEELDGGHGRH